ncbi:hypothetical protein [Joostella sp. CR20]|uniref:hypothetical protein n=1 Tax=Joostella sp. CR20 TaxID=2804312 RepID=UPI00313C148C
MALLKKLKGSTLMETLVATVLIIVIFMISSLILNTLFLGFAKENTQLLDNRIRELKYGIISGTLKTPYDETYDKWIVEISKKSKVKDSLLVFSAENTVTGKLYVKEYILE